MYRLLATCLALCLMIVITGCKASSESQDATTAVGGMMPTGEASPEILYAVDQAEVKVLAERTISKEPLSTFRDKLEEKRAAEAARMATTTESASAGDATTTTAPEEKSVWGSVRSLFGGKKAATGDSAAKSDAPTDDDVDNAKAEDDGDSAEKKEDAGDDEDW